MMPTSTTTGELSELLRLSAFHVAVNDLYVKLGDLHYIDAVLERFEGVRVGAMEQGDILEITLGRGEYEFTKHFTCPARGGIPDLDTELNAAREWRDMVFDRFYRLADPLLEVEASEFREVFNALVPATRRPRLSSAQRWFGRCTADENGEPDATATWEITDGLCGRLGLPNALADAGYRADGPGGSDIRETPRPGFSCQLGTEPGARGRLRVDVVGTVYEDDDIVDTNWDRILGQAGDPQLVPDVVGHHLGHPEGWWARAVTADWLQHPPSGDRGAQVYARAWARQGTMVADLELTAADVPRADEDPAVRDLRQLAETLLERLEVAAPDS